MDRPCAECERLWQECDFATEALRLIEHRSGTETGLEVIVRKASNRSQKAREALQDHEAMHRLVKVTASATS